MKKFLLLPLAVFLFAAAFFQSCKSLEEGTASVKTYDHTVISKWDAAFLEVERYASGYRPGPAPRALALLGLASYEACLTGMPEFQSLAPIYGINIPEVDSKADYHWPSVVNGVHAFLNKEFFKKVDPTYLSPLSRVEGELDAKFRAEVGDQRFETSKSYGLAVAKAVWEWSAGDLVAHDAYVDPFKNYDWNAHFDGPGDWRPTVPGPPQPMFPHWGKARTFAISESEKLCPPPIAYSESTTSPFYAQALEVYAQSGISQTYEGKWIGEFWSDDLLNLTFSPGPRWIAVADQVYQAENSDLETAIFCNVKVGMALNDAAVACWHSKYYYNVERPESYIKRIIDPSYEPSLNNPTNGQTGFTPPFPAYPSGHSTMGAAGAEAIASVFGYAYALTDRCHEGRAEFVGTPRSFNSFAEMAEENAWSRVPLGVHFRMDSEFGVNLGERCGRKVNNLPWKK